MNKLVSSANNKNDNKLELSEKLLTDVKNNKGPKVDSWGTTPVIMMELFDLTAL